MEGLIMITKYTPLTTIDGQQWGANFTYEGSRYYAGPNDYSTYTIWSYSPSGALTGNLITMCQGLDRDTLTAALKKALEVIA
jgi:hypothetical protein